MINENCGFLSKTIFWPVLFFITHTLHVHQCKSKRNSLSVITLVPITLLHFSFSLLQRNTEEFAKPGIVIDNNWQWGIAHHTKYGCIQNMFFVIAKMQMKKGNKKDISWRKFTYTQNVNFSCYIWRSSNS